MAIETCGRGHLRTPETTYIVPRTGKRQCKVCNVIQRRNRGVAPRGSRTHCKHGHEFTPDNTYTNPRGHRHCRTCMRVNDLQRYYRNHDKVRAARRAEWQAKSPLERKHRTLSRHHITATRYTEVLAAQGGGCAICKTPDPGGRGMFQIDHDHTCCDSEYGSCGECFRGLLCFHCNHLLGSAHDNADTLRAAAAYLASPPARPPQ
jgi:hypothetical protein